MIGRKHRSYKLANDTVESIATEYQNASTAAYTAQLELQKANKLYETAAENAAQLETKLIYLLQHSSKKEVTINRVKYSLKNGELVKELILC